MEQIKDTEVIKLSDIEKIIRDNNKILIIDILDMIHFARNNKQEKVKILSDKELKEGLKRIIDDDEKFNLLISMIYNGVNTLIENQLSDETNKSPFLSPAFYSDETQGHSEEDMEDLLKVADVWEEDEEDKILISKETTKCFKAWIDDRLERLPLATNKTFQLTKLWFDLITLDVIESDKDELIDYLFERQNLELAEIYTDSNQPLEAIKHVKRKVFQNIMKFIRFQPYPIKV